MESFQCFLIRHGQSVANEQGLIVSDPANGVEDYGLGELGKKQIYRLLESEACRLRCAHFIYCSDFLRTRETAAIIASELSIPLLEKQELRERYFGDFELTSSDNYLRVWEQDRLDAGHQNWNVESVESVGTRMTKFITNLKESSIVVSHGDPIQILVAQWEHLDLRNHRSVAPVPTAGCVELNIPHDN